MAAIWSPQLASPVYADGERLIIDGLRYGSLVLHSPVVERVQCNPLYQYVRWEEYGPPMDAIHVGTEIRVTILARGSSHPDCRVPDLKAIAEKLTVAELFQVINRKLDKREQ